jgi:translation initiation factor IF-1
MDLYLTSLVLGGAGLGAMALSGVGHHGHAGDHAGHDAGDVSLGAHAGHGGHAGHAGVPGGAAHQGAHAAAHGIGGKALGVLLAPRVWFAFLVGFGAAGLLLRDLAAGWALAALAVLGGVAFEALVVRPLWNFLFRFASRPALTLESTLMDEARAASGFDRAGHGLVAVELDGQVVQVLGTLRAEDRALGVRVRAGDRVRIEDVDAARNRCTVAYLGPS